MPAWPGGPCPNCGELMPSRLIHCQSCRQLLNPELETDSVEIPAFLPLPEIEAMVDVEADGFFVLPPQEDQELRINRKYLGMRVQSKNTGKQFTFDPADSAVHVKAVYATCPHCSKEIRAGVKYLNSKVACKFCSGTIHLVDNDGIA